MIDDTFPKHEPLFSFKEIVKIVLGVALFLYVAISAMAFSIPGVRHEAAKVFLRPALSDKVDDLDLRLHEVERRLQIR